MFKDLHDHIVGFFTELFSFWEIWLFLIIFGSSLPLLNPNRLPAFFLLFLKYTWWFWLFFIFWEIWKELMRYVNQQKFKKNEASPEKYALFEIRIPRELEKSAKSMEHVFHTLHGLGNAPGSWKEEYIEGQVPLWFSLEIVSLGGEIHFYLRMPKKHANLTEVAFFSQYSDVEITEVKDYMRDLPATTAELYALGMDMWGTEFILAKEGAYPIKTYPMFEMGTSERQIDPLSAFLETLAKLKLGETAIVQILISPADKAWSKKYEEILKKLRAPEMVDTGGESKSPLAQTAKKTEIINAIENKLTKPAFNSLVRLCYISPGTILKEGSGFARGGITGAFNQYSAPNLNAFKGNSGTATKADKWKFPYTSVNKRLEYRKQRFLHNVRDRINPPETFTARLFSSYLSDMNFATVSYELATDELATIFHPAPTGVLTAPHMRRVESKKAGPPAGLDIFGEETDLEKFKGK